MNPDHMIEYRRKVVYETYFDVGFVADDGTVENDALADGEYNRVLSEVFECTCGDRFYKESTAAAHLLEVSE